MKRILMSCIVLSFLIFQNICSDSNREVVSFRQKKIVGLVQIRNESNLIKQCLKALSLYTDAIVILDDASEDDTVSICQSLAKECGIETILYNENPRWHEGVESSNRQKLLDAGRAIGGTHFICMDADEMFTANCLKDDLLRNKILALEPGDQLALMWIQLWRSIENYRFDNSVWTWNYKRIIFCDDGISSYHSAFLHGPQCPNNLSGKLYKNESYEYGLMHFQFVNWKNLLIKQSWYRCLEHIRNPSVSLESINSKYAPSKDERNLGLKACPKEWFSGYSSFLDPKIYDTAEEWRQKQIQNWFKHYGVNFFAGLDIWDINWL